MSERSQREPGRARQRAALVGLGIALDLAATRMRREAPELTDVDVDQDIVPIARVASSPPGPSYTFRRSEWRCFGPKREPDEPGDWACRYCGVEHRLDGHAIYTHGCRPAAMPAGLCGGFATYPVAENAVPSIGHPPCPGEPVYRPVGHIRVIDTREFFDEGYVRDPAARLRAPHEHPEIVWLD